MVDADVQEFLDKVKNADCDEVHLGISSYISSGVQFAWTSRWGSSSSAITNVEEKCREIMKEKLDYIYKNVKCKDPCTLCSYEERFTQIGTWSRSNGWFFWWYYANGELTINVSVECCQKDTQFQAVRVDIDNMQIFSWYN